MQRGNLVAAVLALTLFAWAQYSGWNLFANEAGQGQQLRGGSGRAYHK
ncbi:MAG: hypothetical protein OSW77_13495 [Proteobacteria bacterium]|jgi:hypothetical protein|nr:hypothetical protein [Pseudomonadota bacterium]